jgi:casein kinase II subunit beta
MDLYGLIHARFIITPRGLSMMKEKFMMGSFGYCPRVLCERQNVLPIGVSEELSTSRVKVYCPRCQDVYIPRSKQLDIDGAYFGSSFPHIFMKVSKADYLVSYASDLRGALTWRTSEVYT